MKLCFGVRGRIAKIPKNPSRKKKSGNTTFLRKTQLEKNFGKHGISRKNLEIPKKLSWKKKSGNTASREKKSGNTSIATFVFPTSRLSTFVIPTLRFFFSRDAVFPEIFFHLSFSQKCRVSRFFFPAEFFRDFRGSGIGPPGPPRNHTLPFGGNQRSKNVGCYGHGAPRKRRGACVHI